MKQIDISTKLHPSIFALVDDRDYKKLNKHKWHPWASDATSYARRRNSNNKMISMHATILATPNGYEIDHIDGNGLNNTRANIRICTHSENCMNSNRPKNNTSGYKGVTWDKENKKWISQIRIGKKQRKLGRFFCIIKAAKAYDAAARKFFGEFAKCNFPLILPEAK